MKSPRVISHRGFERREGEGLGGSPSDTNNAAPRISFRHVAYLAGISFNQCRTGTLHWCTRLFGGEPTIGAALMAQILPFVRRRNVFDPDATLAMGDAYDKAIATIQTDAQSQFVVRELIAKRIIRMAQKGVIDRRQLCIGIIER